MNIYLYIFICLFLFTSCQQSDKYIIDRHLVLLAYLELENKEPSDVSENQFEQLFNASKTRHVSKNIYVTRFDYGSELDLSSSWKQLYYLQDLDTNFKFAFGSKD